MERMQPEPLMRSLLIRMTRSASLLSKGTRGVRRARTGRATSREPALEQGAATAIRLATLPDDGPSGAFFEDEGVVPW
jgi:hypothetical protein